MVVVLSVLADVSTDLAPYTQIANYGLLGLITYALFTGRIVPARLYDQALADRAREHEELIALRVKTEEQFIPAVIRNTELLSRVAERLER